MDFSDLDQRIAGLGSAYLVERLGPFITEDRRAKIEQVLAGRLDSLHVAVERPDDPYNAAAIVRTAEALGALHVHVAEAREDTLHARKTTQGSYNMVYRRGDGTIGWVEPQRAG